MISKNEIRNKTIDELLSLVEKGQISEPQKFVLPLDTALNNKQYSFTGNFIYVQEATDNNVVVDIGLNRSDADKFQFSKGFGLIFPFKSLFIDSTAQSGKTITILIFNFAPEIFDVIDNRSALELTSILDEILKQIKGNTTSQEGGARVQLSAEGQVLASNTDRVSYTLHNPIANNTMYIRHGSTTVTTTNYRYALEGGQTIMIDNYQGEVRALASTTGQYLHYGED